MAKLSIVPSESANSTVPAHLRPATRAWYLQICNDFQLESHHLKILQLVCEAWDTYELARTAVAENGMTYINLKHGDVKPRPEISIMQNSRLAVMRGLRELNLDVAPPETPRGNPLKYAR